MGTIDTRPAWASIIIGAALIAAFVLAIVAAGMIVR